MSGICGIVNLDGQPVARSPLEAMVARLAYRGPDAQEIWLEGNVGFGHTLLRTTWESAREQQPCTLDGQVYITADARIDDRANLIPRLQAQDCLVSASDPDVNLILHAYQLWGEACLESLLGDFVFALWDRRHRKLFCARDRFGLRVIYYARLGNTLVFSNSLNCVRAYPGVTNALNELAIADFLLFGSHTWLDKSITAFADIQKLPPASSLSWSEGNLVIKPYWEFPLEVPLLQYKNDEDYLEHFRSVFKTCVRDRLRCDRVVISMSGGMDSTTVAAAACQLVREGASSTQLQAITAVYDRIHPDRERYFAGLVAEKLRLPIEYFVCDDYCLLNPFWPLVEPSEAYTPARDLDLTRRMASYSSVVLSGDCADNLLCLWPPHTLLNQMRQKNPLVVVQDALRLWRQYHIRQSVGTGAIAKLQGRAARNWDAPTYAYPDWLNPAFEKRFQLKERWQQLWSWYPSPLNQRHPGVHRWIQFPNWNRDNEYLVENKSVNNSVNNLEYRDPFLDLRLVEFILSLPPYPWLVKKYLLRRAMEDILPLQVVRRPKTPLGNLQNSLIKQKGTDWIDRWQSVPELDAYVNCQKVPPITVEDASSESIYTGVRPLLLNLWLQQLNGRKID